MPGVLNSWKEIAVFLQRGVRTTQRWERTRGLPVHRIGTGSKAPVIAFPGEIQDWLRATPVAVTRAVVGKVTVRVPLDRDAVERHRRLRMRTKQLLQLQRKKLSALVKSLEAMDGVHKTAPLHRRPLLMNDTASRGPARIIIMPH
jgi:hypothetical protein